MNEKENHLPNLSDKERAHALELAMKARKRRAVLKARMKSGELAFTDALNDYEILGKYRRGVMKVAKRETAVLIRLSEREKRTLKRKAANYGMTVSEYARTLLIHSDDVTIKVIDTEPLKKTAHELAKQGTNLNQFMKFLNTYGIKVFDAGEAQRVLAREVETFMEVAEALAALRREADRNNIQIRIDDFDNPDAEQEG